MGESEVKRARLFAKRSLCVRSAGRDPLSGRSVPSWFRARGRNGREGGLEPVQHRRNEEGNGKSDDGKRAQGLPEDGEQREGNGGNSRSSYESVRAGWRADAKQDQSLLAGGQWP